MAKHRAFGTTFKWGATGTVAGLSNIGGISVSVDTADVTSHDSTDGWEEVVATIKRTGELTIEGYFDPTDTDGQVAMYTAAGSSTATACTITYPSETKTVLTFNAFITGVTIGNAPHDGFIDFSATLKITGKPTLTITP